MQGIADIPEWLSIAWGITEATAQIVLSVVVILAVLLPVMYLNKRKGITIELIMFFLTECFLIGVGWMPYWVMVGTVAVMAIAIAMLGSNVVTGGG